METLLAVMTILGGIGAIGYFIDKARKSRRQAAAQTPGQQLAELERTIISSDPQSDWTRHAHDQCTTTIYNKDVNLRLEMKFEGRGVQAEHFREPWAMSFPDSDATGYFCDLFYGASLLKRFILVSVDGGRALLPITRSRTDLTAATLDHRIAQIHDYSHTLALYMDLAHMRAEDVGRA